MSVPDNLLPTHREKTTFAMGAQYAIKQITFDRSEAKPGNTLDVRVPKLNENEVLVPGSLALCFDIDLSGGHANIFLVQNVLRTLVSQLVVKFGGTTLDDTVDYDIYKIFANLFLPGEKRDNMVSEGTQSEDLCKICSGVGDKKTTGVGAEKKTRRSLQQEILHQSRPSDPDWPRRFLSTGSVHQPCIWSDSRNCQPSGQRAWHNQSEIQAVQHRAWVWNDQQWKACKWGCKYLHRWQRVLIWSREPFYSAPNRQNTPVNQHRSQLPKKIHERHSLARGASQCGGKRSGHKIAPNTGTNATKFLTLATKSWKLIAKLATRISNHTIPRHLVIVKDL